MLHCDRRSLARDFVMCMSSWKVLVLRRIFFVFFFLFLKNEAI